MSESLPDLADVDCPAAQLAVQGAQLRQAIWAAAGGTADECALDARLVDFTAAPSVDRSQSTALFWCEGVAGLVQHGILARAPDDRLYPRFAVRLVNGSLIITDLPVGWQKLPALYVDPLWEGALPSAVGSPCVADQKRHRGLWQPSTTTGLQRSRPARRWR